MLRFLAQQLKVRFEGLDMRVYGLPVKGIKW